MVAFLHLCLSVDRHNCVHELLIKNFRLYNAIKVYEKKKTNSVFA